MKAFRNKVVYTAVFGDYDHVSPINPEWNCDFICFTDNPSIVSSGWKIVIVQLNGEIPVLANRRYKMLPHKYLADYDYSLYVDGNIKILVDPSPLFQKYLDRGIIAIPKHQDRDCAYAEARACVKAGLVDKEMTDEQMAQYLAQGFPERYGLTANATILRKHLDANVLDLMESWWSEYCSGARRDQLSLQYSAWKKSVVITLMEEEAQANTKYFQIVVHQALRRKSFVGRLVDYMGCNRYRNIFFKAAHKIIHRFSENRLLRRFAR